MVVEVAENAYVLGKSKSVFTIDTAPAAQPTMTVVEEQVWKYSDIVFWGEDNNFPARVVEQAMKVAVVPPSLFFHANMLSGSTILPVIKHYEADKNGVKEIIEVVSDPEIWEFINSVHFKRYRREAAVDLFWFQNVFPELILTKNRKKIAYISPNEAMHCRWGKQNTRGICEAVFVSANWPNTNIQSKYTTEITAIDPYAYDIVEGTRDRVNDYKFIYPASYPSPGRNFYQLAFWDGIRQSGWLDILTKIPQLKSHLLSTQMRVAYHIQVPAVFWEKTYGKKWKDADPSQRRQIKMDYFDELDKILAGDANAGKAFVSEYGMSLDGKASEKWEIDPIKDPNHDGKFVNDSIEATANLFYALGIDLTLAGFASKEMGSRSGGSDKREALLIYLEKMKPLREIELEPLRFVAKFNSWTKKYPMLDFIHQTTLLTTLDTGAASKQVTT